MGFYGVRFLAPRMLVIFCKVMYIAMQFALKFKALILRNCFLLVYHSMRRYFGYLLLILAFVGTKAERLIAQQAQSIPQYTVSEKREQAIPGTNNYFGWNFVPYIVQGEDRFQSYIQDNGLSVWVNIPSLQKNGDTLTAVVKRVVRYDITHRLSKDLVYVDVMRFNTRNDTFARIASLDTKTGSLAMNPKPEWEKTNLDLDMTALYHFMGYLHTEKQKK